MQQTGVLQPDGVHGHVSVSMLIPGPSGFCVHSLQLRFRPLPFCVCAQSLPPVLEVQASRALPAASAAIPTPIKIVKLHTRAVHCVGHQPLLPKWHPLARNSAQQQQHSVKLSTKQPACSTCGKHLHGALTVSTTCNQQRLYSLMRAHCFCLLQLYMIANSCCQPPPSPSCPAAPADATKCKQTEADCQTPPQAAVMRHTCRCSTAPKKCRSAAALCCCPLLLPHLLQQLLYATCRTSKQHTTATCCVKPC